MSQVASLPRTNTAALSSFGGGFNDQGSSARFREVVRAGPHLLIAGRSEAMSSLQSSCRRSEKVPATREARAGKVSTAGDERDIGRPLHTGIALAESCPR
jgi:hypothetical protein